MKIKRGLLCKDPVYAHPTPYSTRQIIINLSWKNCFDHNSNMTLQLTILFLALIFQRVLSNFEIEIDPTTSFESCDDPVETAPESNCYCYNEPEVDFEYR